MRIAKIGFATMLLAAALSGPAAAQGPLAAGLHPAPYHAVAVAVGANVGPVGFDYFYRNLSPHGYWAQRPNYGWVWMPRRVASGWRPYTVGRWVYTDYGWTWDSSEDWGWATYHYGRWYDDPEYGWSWVPGTDWGPAWVSWQEGGDYVGWAALPPAVGWSAGVGLDLGGFNLSVGIAPADYCFVGTRSFLAANVGAFVLAPERNAAIFRTTNNITNYGWQNGRVFNRGVQLANAERWTGRPVPQYRFAAMSNGGPRGARLAGNTLSMFRPASVVRRANTPDPARVAPRAVASAAFLAGRAQAHRQFAARAGLPTAGPAVAQRAGAVRPNEAGRAAAARPGSRPSAQVAGRAAAAQRAQASRQAAARNFQRAQGAHQRAAVAGRQQTAGAHRQPAGAAAVHQRAPVQHARPAGVTHHAPPPSHSQAMAHRAPAAAPAHRQFQPGAQSRTVSRPSGASRPASPTSPTSSGFHQQAVHRSSAGAPRAQAPARSAAPAPRPQARQQQPPPQRQGAQQQRPGGGGGGGGQGRQERHTGS